MDGANVLALGVAARVSGCRPSHLLPPIEHETLALDFDVAVTSHLFNFERREQWQLMKAQARLTAQYTELLRLGGTIPDDEPGESAAQRQIERQPQGVPKFVQIVVDGEKKSAPAPPPGWVYNAQGHLVEVKPLPGNDIGDTGLKTKASPRIIGGCQHIRHKPEGDQLRCLDCGALGN